MLTRYYWTEDGMEVDPQPPKGSGYSEDHFLKATDVAALEARLAEIEEEGRADLHADINRRVAAALGKPPQGEGSSWHDLPECVSALRARLAEIEKQRCRTCGKWDARWLICDLTGTTEGEDHGCRAWIAKEGTA